MAFGALLSHARSSFPACRGFASGGHGTSLAPCWSTTINPCSEPAAGLVVSSSLRLIRRCSCWLGFVLDASLPALRRHGGCRWPSVAALSRKAAMSPVRRWIRGARPSTSSCPAGADEAAWLAEAGLGLLTCGCRSGAGRATSATARDQRSLRQPARRREHSSFLLTSPVTARDAVSASGAPSGGPDVSP